MFGGNRLGLAFLVDFACGNFGAGGFLPLTSPAFNDEVIFLRPLRLQSGADADALSLTKFTGSDLRSGHEPGKGASSTRRSVWRPL